MRKFDPRRSGRRALVVIAVPVALLASGCTATGGGSIPSQIPLSANDRATFGFTIESLNPDTGTGTWSGSYHDPHGITDFGPLDVRFKGTGKTHRCNTDDPLCMKLAPPTKGLCIAAEAPYQSQNPAIPGSGTVFWEVCDFNSNGVADVDGTDTLLVFVEDGPYMGYENGGNVQGNITTRS